MWIPVPTDPPRPLSPGFQKRVDAQSTLPSRNPLAPLMRPPKKRTATKRKTRSIEANPYTPRPVRPYLVPTFCRWFCLALASVFQDCYESLAKILPPRTIIIPLGIWCLLLVPVPVYFCMDLPLACFSRLLPHRRLVDVAKKYRILVCVLSLEPSLTSPVGA